MMAGEMNDLAQILEKDLLEQYGPLLNSNELMHSLGYPSMGAFQQAITRGKIPFPIFQLKGRRGRFALAKDVATWLAEQRNNSNINSNNTE